VFFFTGLVFDLTV